MPGWFSRSSAPPAQISVQQLWVYPIKSCRGTSVQASAYTEEGLEYDRQWMIVEAASHKFLTARTIPKMVLINPSINRDTGALDIEVPSPSPDTAPQSFSVPLAHPTSYLDDPTDDPSLDHDFVVWGSDPQDGFSVGTDDLRAALSAFMGREVLLIRKGLTRRSVADVPGVVHSEGLDPVLGFADFYPFLIGSAKSLDELTSRIPSLSADPAFDSSRWSPSAIASKGGLEISRFRANIVVEGTSEPWEEDGWKQLVIGEEPIEVGFRCARCMLPSVDPVTAKRDKLLPDGVMKDRVVQPLSALKVCFGVLCSPRKKSGGTLRVGDPVKVLDAYPKPASGPYVRDEDRTN
ncbi:MOSC N-terminal beta barrel domain-containing protein [Rhodotorula diobovata]|uniref:MOSC N-terminal beta barrel domain-containing protein n=1 Tax=Rhodotorula diobovata TaxID=5288 RepID=A0A5C5FNE5_9BASI|nr:MOSC N-terminal beta barrel domain-containing protein [Rhodotorula diobovata]